MRIAEYIFSAIVAFAIAYVIFNSKEEQRPESVSNSANNFSITFTTIPTAFPESILNIPVTITGPSDSTLKFWFRHVSFQQTDTSRLYQYDKRPLQLLNPDSGLYQATIQTGKRSNVLHYYFEVRDRVGRSVVDLKGENGAAIQTHVIGKVDSWIFYGYFLTMFLAMFSVAKGSIGSIAIAGGKGNLTETNRFFIIGLVFNFVSAFVLKTWYGFQLSADVWGAVPFGTSLVDNFQQVFMLYLILMVVVSGIAKSTISKNVIGLLGIFSFFLMAAVYLLPMVLVSDSFPVTTVSYTAIAIILLAIIFLSRAANRA